MSLEQKIRRGKLSRRDFIRLGLGGITALGLGISQACKKKSPFTPKPPKPQIPVSLNFEVYNHTQGPTGVSFTKTYMSGDQVTINIQDLIKEYGISIVNKERIAVRQEKFGELIGFSNNKEVIFTAPNQNKNYDIYLFNASNNAPYECMDEQNANLYLNKRNYVVYRKDFDGQDDGPEIIWKNAIDPLKRILNPDWAPFRYGSIKRKPKPNDGVGDFSYGFGAYGGWDGAHAGSWITVNWHKYPGSILFLTNIAIEELFENITCTQNICGNPSSHYTSRNGEWTPIGIDLVTYVFVKDEAPVSTSTGLSIGFW